MDRWIDRWIWMYGQIDGWMEMTMDRWWSRCGTCEWGSRRQRVTIISKNSECAVITSSKSTAVCIRLRSSAHEHSRHCMEQLMELLVCTM